MNLITHVAQFAGALRAAGVRVAIGDEVDALAALGRVDVGDPEEVRWGLRCALKIRPRDAETSERLFAALWRAGLRDYRMVFNVPGDPVAEVTAAFRALIDTLAEGRTPDLEAMRRVGGGVFTRGHFARAV